MGTCPRLIPWGETSACTALVGLEGRNEARDAAPAWLGEGNVQMETLSVVGVGVGGRGGDLGVCKEGTVTGGQERVAEGVGFLWP